MRVSVVYVIGMCVCVQVSVRVVCVNRCCAYVCVSLQSYRNHESNENVFVSAGVVNVSMCRC